MSKIQPTAPATLRIWQQNARKSLTANDYILNQANPAEWDIILIQEPYIDHFGNARGNQYWRVLYPSNHLTDDQARTRSIILINTNIATNSYTSLPIPNSDITAIRLDGDFGHCSIFNIYNDCTHNGSLEALATYLTEYGHIARPSDTDHMLWFGDFNRHHPLWEEEGNRGLFNCEAFIEPLLDLISDYDMTMALPPNTPTYETVTGNWTRPDNVWRSANNESPITRCNVDASIRPPLADHLPIITVLDLPIPRSETTPTRNLREADFAELTKSLSIALNETCPAKEITDPAQFEDYVCLFIDTVNDHLNEKVPFTKPSPYTKRWWTRELTDLRKLKNKLSNVAYKHRGLPNHPIHAEHKKAANHFTDQVKETKTQHWIEFLEDATSEELYIAHKYAVAEPSDYGKARVPSLNTSINGTPFLATLNEDKARALAETFFPPPPEQMSTPPTAYPKPLIGIKCFTRSRIREVIAKLHAWKAPGPDGIPNAVLMKCTDALIEHLYFIYKAILELGVYPTRWLMSTTVVLRKAGKPAYDVSKAYRPIGLLDTMGKLLSTLIANDLSYLAEKYNLLPQTQFGGRAGRCTTDAMHLVVQKIKDAWRVGKVATALFLDVQAAFPNTVKTRLLHNLRSRRVPEGYVTLFDTMLTERFTRLKFDDHMSDPIRIINGTTQGCPLSMLLYAFYNADLIDIAKGKSELSTGFVDDAALVAISPSLDENRTILKNMMERNLGGFDWSVTHNSPFELTKLAVLDFPRSFRDTATYDLTLERNNPNGPSTTQTVQPVNTYKYLGVHFDSKLRWTAHTTKVIASAQRWANKIRRLAKVSGGLPPSKVRQLYNTVAVPAFTYAADIWYVGLHKSQGSEKTSGSVGITKKLASIQRRVTKCITGAISTTAGDIMEVHANILPMELLFHKVLYRAATRLCTLTDTNPLFSLARRAASRYVKKHRSPLHHLFYTTRLKPNNVETIAPTRRRPSYRPAFSTSISDNKESALERANEANSTIQTRIYCDGSGFEGGIGAAAVLYIGNAFKKSLRYYLGKDTMHTVYEAETLGIIMGLHLLTELNRELDQTCLIGSDSQATIRALNNQRNHPGQYLHDEVHNSAERLHQKQDSIIREISRNRARRRGEKWKAKKRDVVDLRIEWVPGHVDFEPNEKADSEAKKAAQGKSSQQAKLPSFLRNEPLPASVAALQQMNTTSLQKRWNRKWKMSPRYLRHRAIDKSAPSKKYLKLTRDLRRGQASLLTQLRTGHIGLNQHLFRIKRSDTPSCPHCRGITPETVRHFIFDCPHYRRARHDLQRTLRRKAGHLSYLLSHPDAIIPLLKYVHATGRLKQTFGDIYPNQ